MKRAFGFTASAALVLAACSQASSPGSAPPPSTAPTSAATARSASLEPTRTPRPTPAPPPGVEEVFDLPFRPSGIVVSEDLVWAEDHAQSQAVYAIDPQTGQTVATIEVTRPCDVAAGLDRIWIADLDAGRLLSIDPTTQDVQTVATELHGPCGVQAVDGAVWLAVDEGLARVDPQTGAISIEELGAAAFPGAGIPLWAALFDTGELVRIDSASGAATLTIPHPTGLTEGPPIAAGLGALWVGDSSSEGLYRLDPTTGAVQAEIPATQATRLLVTADAVWLTSYPNGVVERIDPATNAVVYRAQLGGNPNGITEGFGAIWVADTGQGLLYRIDPGATGIVP